jgi:TRAP-type uncharacterized transport system fused permease subunit
MGVVPIAAHLFLFYFGLMSMVTPPVCLATFAAASIAGCDFWRAGWAGMRFAIVAYLVPFVMVYQPQLVFSGTALDVVLVTAKSILGVAAVSLGMVGFLYALLGAAARLAFALGGLALLLVPLDIAYGPLLVAAAGLLVVGLALYLRRTVSGVPGTA